MKKIFIFIAIAMVAAILMSGMSFGFDFFDNLFDKSDDDTSYEENVFYYFDGDELKESSDLSKVPDGSRGFYINDDITYFCYKTPGDDAMMAHLDLTENSSIEYDICSKYTVDMKTVSAFDDGSTCLDRATLYIYSCVTDCEDPEDVHKDLVDALTLSIIYYDPQLPEGPSAE